MSYSSQTQSSWHRALAIGAALIAACVTLALPQQAPAETKPKTHIKFATLAPDGSTWMKVMHSIDEEVRAATQNRIGFKFYPGAVQGDEKDVLRKIRNGQVHGGGFTGYGLGAIASEYRVIELPFMFKSVEEIDYVRGELDPFIYDTFKKKGFVFLGWADVGFVYLFSNTPITTPDELKQAKMWTWSGDVLAEIFFKAFNVSPIPLALPDVLTSLQMGVIDAAYSSPLACVALQWFTRVKYMTDVPITYGFGAMLVSEEALRGVDPADVETLKQICRKHSKLLVDKTRQENAEAIEAMKKEGVKVLEVKDEIEKDFFTTGRAAWRDGVGRLYPDELLQRVTALVDGYRAGGKGTSRTP
ncbi:MAG: TRAP-type C4-dicarboxylate transport system, substrate-binding protein [Candidatus Krumholzibacteriota bacterium]|nr:TRAP-type C4-dicarboxylate transport system, substrate-binding protein [Candidatus Krumholzibacteriota bacterium]